MKKPNLRCGLNNKISVEQVKLIKFEWKDKRPAKDIAKELNINVNSVYKIWSGDNWEWVTK